jgi:hypothetical protein
LGLLFPIDGKIKNVPNHQPVLPSTLVVNRQTAIINWNSTTQNVEKTKT